MRVVHYDPRAMRDVRKYRGLYVRQAPVNIAIVVYVIICAVVMVLV